MSRLFRAWYVFLALGLLTFILTAFVGSLPYSLSAAVALPHNLLHGMGRNIRQAVLDTVDRRNYQQEIARLERRVAELEARNRQLMLDNENFAQIRLVRESQSPGVVSTAPVIGVDSSPLLSRITLGLGRADGVRKNMPVTVPEGLIGLVTDVTERTATVRAITDPESRVGVTVRDRGGQGVAVGELGGLVRVTNYYPNDPVQVGDLVETSSRGGLFPRGIHLGEIIEVLPPDPNQLRIEFLVKPAVEVPNLLEVALIEPL